MHLGEVRLLAQGLLVIVDRLGPSSLAAEVHPEVLEDLGRVGPELVRGQEPLHGLVELALVGEHDPQVHLRVERVGLDSSARR